MNMPLAKGPAAEHTRIEIPGTTCTADVMRVTLSRWAYRIWAPGTGPLGVGGELDFRGADVTPMTVAKAAFILKADELLNPQDDAS